MGICKCKKRSEDFCYQHKKFICETCVVPDHPVVYLFHPECIDVYASTLPQTTALAGYSCPSCKKPILPPSDKVDPLSQSIRKAFMLSSWADSILNISGGGGGGGKYTNGPALASSILSPTGSSDGSSPHNINAKQSLTNGINGHNDYYTSPTSSTTSINNSLLEETPPLSHLNNNPYGLAIRKPQQQQQQQSTEAIINMGENNLQDEEEDKYNKKILPLQSLMRFKQENQKTFYIIVAIICILTFYVFSKFNSSTLPDTNSPPTTPPIQGGQGNNPDE
ncbi:hypothetical protein DFA_11564 [Cavenderia fasciculata]|uniref:ZFPL1-like B-box zinc-binding domain-containing protein n=1 Tax=Cavenderia fasciculata TaxID=261658 RepID=F4QDK6_CACFS|nr:uncharacterized protein DFA_11564 [Cavenderia fasciculata]EGG13803.1 hypothetical protein DFA_11564 [Cavenderia fasciculata]|eukprot:XP_004350511.1 hypothetical protein DFA_11564 [Cavenderia fasciculata]